MNFRVIILPAAENDIERNAKWWADNYSSEQASRWLWAVHNQLKALKDFPESNALSAENDQFPYEIRDKFVGFGSRPRYRAVFTIKDDEVFVLTVRAVEENQLILDDVDFYDNSVEIG